MALSLQQYADHQITMERFPKRPECRQALLVNEDYQKHLEAKQRIRWHEWSYWQEALDETERRRQIWDTLDWIWIDPYDVELLEELRRLLGDEMFGLGVMPTPIPGRWLEVID